MRLYILSLFVAVSLLFMCAPSAAAQTDAHFIISQKTNTLRAGDTFDVAVAIDPGATKIDTARLVLVYPREILEAVQVQLDPSFMASPANEIDATQGLIRWGGFTTKGIEVSTDFVHIIFRAKKEGNAIIAVEERSLLLSGGKNYFDGVKKDLEIVIAASSGVSAGSVGVDVDTTPPREPVPIFEVIGRDETHVIIDSQFGSTDDLSGVDHYEMMVDGGGFQTVQSPYRIYAPLKEMIPIIVRVYDRSGNSIDHMSSVSVSLESLPFVSGERMSSDKQEAAGYDYRRWGYALCAATALLFIVIYTVMRRYFKKNA